MKPNFAIFRYPDSSEYAYVECDDGDVTLSSSVAAVGSTDGFVLAPFDATDTTPVVTLKGKPARLASSHAGELDSPQSCRIMRERADRQQYGRDFDAFHRLVDKGTVSKIVLARTEDVETDTAADAFAMFAAACRQNPHCFVALVRTTVAGTWLTATPEILLERCGGVYRTMALAGTMSLRGDTEECVWSEKNRTEQRLVADYIRGIVKEYTCDRQKTGRIPSAQEDWCICAPISVSVLTVRRNLATSSPAFIPLLLYAVFPWHCAVNSLSTMSRAGGNITVDFADRCLPPICTSTSRCAA